MEQQFDLDMPRKCMENAENIEETNKKVREALEVIMEEAKYSGSAQLIASAEVLYNNATEAYLPSQEETKKNYEEAAEELQRMFAALN